MAVPDAEWKATLTPIQYKVLRKKGTEPAFSGELWNNHAKGTYVCAGCGQALFSSETNFEPGRVFANELDFQDQLDAWATKVNAREHRTIRARPCDRRF